MKKWPILGVLLLGLAGSVWAANTPTYTDIAGVTRDALGVAPIDQTGQPYFTCASQTSATITAAATTQIIALQASQVIRVCAYQIGIATTGTWRFIQGTGSNCATGAAGVTPATTLTSGNVVTQSAPSGAAVLRTAAGNALCVEAVTGNVQVFVNYAQF